MLYSATISGILANFRPPNPGGSVPAAGRAGGAGTPTASARTRDAPAPGSGGTPGAGRADPELSSAYALASTVAPQ